MPVRHTPDSVHNGVLLQDADPFLDSRQRQLDDEVMALRPQWYIQHTCSPPLHSFLSSRTILSKTPSRTPGSDNTH